MRPTPPERLVIVALFLAACSGGPPAPSVDPPAWSGPVRDTDTPDTDDTGEPEDTASHLGLPCEPGFTNCGAGAECCTECCLGDAIPVCTAVDEFGACPLPDLSLDLASMATSVDVQDIPFGDESCAALEGCIDAPGDRRVLRFTTTTPNTGTADVFFGDVSGGDEFEYSECHEHTHFSSYADYELFTLDGSLAGAGHKQAFCLMDNQNWGSAGGARYSCDFQGISVGWADAYASWLDCQWIDVTEVPPGDYMLRVTINPDALIPERDYSNNAEEVMVTIVERGALPPVTDDCPGLAYGEYRDCGWQLASTHTCTAGANVVVSCDSTCLGACEGDPVLRVCEGADSACHAWEALGANDRAECGSWCPEVTVLCPESGVLTALTAGWASDQAGSCTVTATEL